MCRHSCCRDNNIQKLDGDAVSLRRGGPKRAFRRSTYCRIGGQARSQDVDKGRIGFRHWMILDATRLLLWKKSDQRQCSVVSLSESSKLHQPDGHYRTCVPLQYIHPHPRLPLSALHRPSPTVQVDGHPATGVNDMCCLLLRLMINRVSVQVYSVSKSNSRNRTPFLGGFEYKDSNCGTCYR